jgi:Na+-transporting methylmalonyl-CoA/oxaloacetate decarboxylase gamma subunit
MIRRNIANKLVLGLGIVLVLLSILIALLQSGVV